jgi:AraC-like DNA-binding protein
VDRRARVARSDAGPHRWELATRPLPAHLRAHVRGLVGYSEVTPGPHVRHEWPGARVVVIVEFGPRLRVDGRTHAGGFVAGVHAVPARTEHDGFQAGIQCDLTPLAARALFGLPLSELTDVVVDLDDVLPRSARRLAERLAGLPTWDDRFDMFEGLLTARLAAPPPRLAPVAWAWQRLVDTCGGADIGGLARELGCSPKHLITLFRDHVGVPPKQAARLVRFDRLVARLRTGAPVAWADLAAELGYSDQAHMVREVRRFTGDTPTAALGHFDGLASAA